jgi:hypothetical protein
MQPVLADVALPTFIVFWPPLIFLFIPICAIELWVLKWKWRVPAKAAMWPVVKANIFSATVGYLATWVLVLLALMAASACLPQATGKGRLEYYLFSILAVGGQMQYYPELDWLAGATFLILAYFMSVVFEAAVLRGKLPGLSKSEAWRASWQMNLWSYLFLGGVWVWLLVEGGF